MAICASLDLIHLLMAAQALPVVSREQPWPVLSGVTRFLVTGFARRRARSYRAVVMATGTERLSVAVEPAGKLALAYQLIEMGHNLPMGKLRRLVVLCQHVNRDLLREVIRRRW